MKLSKLVCERTKEIPNDAMMKNHILLLRAGYIKQVANGIFSLSVLGQKTCNNIENIIRQEMDKVDGQEVKFPVVMPKEMWDETGRYSSIGSEMARFKDRNNHDMLLGMTHEEAAVHLARNWVNSYTNLPCMIYQIQTKFRDEPRSRGGLIRVREFTMKDAYSFHMTEEDLNDYYFKMHEAYERIYKRIGLKNNVISVKSDNGMFGGNLSHEFMYLNEFGEDELVLCENCDYKANQEVAECIYPKTEKQNLLKLEIVDTKDAKEINEVCDFLKTSAEKCIKAVVFAVKNEKNTVVCFVRGDKEINETKLRKVCKKEIVPFDASNESEFCAGNIGPKDFAVKNCEMYFDLSLKGTYNMVAGANLKNHHFVNFNLERDFGEVEFFDISKVKNGDICPVCGKKTKIFHGIEIGNIFQLGTKYSKSMKMLVKTSSGEEINPIMGCYGIGVGRNLACVVEENLDEKGICMPISIAPYKVHICPLRIDDKNVERVSNEIYNELIKKGMSVLIDDRDVFPGIKFSDADLMGMPIRVVVSPRSLEKGEVEIKERKSGEIVMEKKENAVKKIFEIISKENQN
ncbi:MAG: proline--tRNA ligase [Clostridia bacterium]|nr:proline--tRNA ligase [Clostridia bacterium]